MDKDSDNFRRFLYLYSEERKLLRKIKGEA